MNIFVLLAAALLLILVLLRKHVQIGPAMLAGGLLIWAVESRQVGLLAQAFQEEMSLSRTYDIVLALYFVMCLEIELRQSGALSGMVGALRHLFSSDATLVPAGGDARREASPRRGRREASPLGKLVPEGGDATLVPAGGTKLLLALMPAFLGLLPSLGGARFSAPIVEELGKGIDLSADRKSAINFWFRHLFEFSSPIIPGMIMACSIAGVPFSAFLRHLSWLTVLAFALGWLVLIHPIKTSAMREETEAGERHDRMDLALSILPVLATFLLVVLLDFNASMGLGVVSAILFFVLRGLGRPVPLKEIVLGAFDRNMLLNVLGILYFIQLLAVTDVLTEIVAAFQNSALPVPVIIACVSFIIGILTGMSQGHVAIVMPIVAAMGTGNLDLAGIAMAFGVAGQMLTPTHLCLVVTIDYFKSDLFGTLKPVLLCEILLLSIFSLYTYATWQG